MGNVDVQELFRRAIADNDAAAMRDGLERMLGIAESGSLSAEREYELRRPDFVMEMPQSGERLRGRDAMRQMQERFPGGGPSVTLRRVTGGDRVWVAEVLSRYGDDPWHVVVIFELDGDGLIARETRYYTQSLGAADWRADLVEPMEPMEPMEPTDN